MSNIQEFRFFDKETHRVVGHRFFNHDLNIMTQDWVEDLDISPEDFNNRIIVFPYTEYRFE